ncbi:MAG: hypothetical protein CL940_08655 [Deltaproteobacteria bacterium]|nr:hypothetical protein [Deltaproteobacteria bacterium]
MCVNKRSLDCAWSHSIMSRRQAYRVPVPDRGNIKLSVEVAGWPAIAARICDATADGLGISIPSEIPLPVSRGELLRLTVWLVHENRAITLEADVKTVQEQGDSRRYGVRFLNADRARRELSEVLGLVFNRRSAPRVPAQPGQHATVTAREGGSLEFKAAVTNVSEGGVGVRLPLSAASIATNMACFVNLELDDDGAKVTLPGRICHHQSASEDDQWGIALEVDPSLLDEQCYAQFRSYVIDRTREASIPA